MFSIKLAREIMQMVLNSSHTDLTIYSFSVFDELLFNSSGQQSNYHAVFLLLPIFV